MTKIIHLTIEGREALGFDTGLDSQAFAQAKMAQFINQPGHIILPSGDAALWRAAAVAEREGTMVVWGPDFPGKRFEDYIEAGADEALDALRYWLAARRRLLVLEEGASGEGPAPSWPGGTLLADQDGGAYPRGTVLIPPERLLRRTLAAEGDSAWLLAAERWVHPNRSGADGLAFTAAALLYRILCGIAPYQSGDADTLRQDITEGVFTPPGLSAPGLNDDAAALIAGLLAPPDKTRAAIQPRAKEGADYARLEQLAGLLGAPGSRNAASFFHALTGEERAKLDADREQRQKMTARRVTARRFLRRNLTILGASLGGLALAGLIAGSIIKGRLELPTTKGMSPPQVLEAYYGAITSLDHTLMEACVMGKAGKEDISMVTNTFVISRVRQAYEMNIAVISPQEWLDRGAPATDAAVFGVSDLRFTAEDTDEHDGEVSYQARYRLWLPQGYQEEGAPGGEFSPHGIPMTDRITLSLHKGAWRITALERQTDS
jgi:hypothetical protein